MRNVHTTSKEVIDIEKLFKKRAQHIKQDEERALGMFGYTAEGMARMDGLKSIFIDPLNLNTNQFGHVHTISPYYGRMISYRVLRRVSEKAWILNLCISNLIKKVRPFLKRSTEENMRGFRVRKKTKSNKKNIMTAVEKQTAEALEEFILHTGDVADSQRDDDLDKYVSKIIRDICQLDQVSSEVQRTYSGEVCAFWAVDPATIEIALPLSEASTGIKYVQVVDNIPYAYYSKDGLIFDCMNPRTDLERSGYGYSVVEQAIDLITSSINTFMFNAGFFTENKLPRGILLLNGDADADEVEEIEDYIVNLMSGTPTSQWRVPIIPAGKNTGGDGRRFEWVSLQGTNKEMEFQAWFDLQLSGIVGLFGFSMEDLGLHSQKSAPLIGNDAGTKIEASKSLVLGDMLTFLQKHFNTILQYKNPDYVFEFVGYEKDNPKLITDIDKEEVASYKSLNEKRIEKGQNPLDFTKITNPADLPMNPQVIQAWQAAQQESTESDTEDDGDDEYYEDLDAELMNEPDIDSNILENQPEIIETEGKNNGWNMMEKSLKGVQIII